MNTINNTIVKKLFAAWNSHNAEAVLNFYHNNFIRKDMSNDYIYSKEKLQKIIENYIYAFPDVFFDIDDLMEKDGQIVVCWTADGHHRGKIMNIPATGKHITFKGVSVLSIENQKIKNVWYLWDEASMLRQMGLLPELQHAPVI